MNLIELFVLMKRKGFPYYEGNSSEGLYISFSEFHNGRGRGVDVTIVSGYRDLTATIYPTDRRDEIKFSEKRTASELLSWLNENLEDVIHEAV